MPTRYPRNPRHLKNRVAEPTPTYADWLPCPQCGHQIPLSTEGQHWTIRGPSDVALRLLARYGKSERESLIVLTLNAKHTVMDEREVYRGNVSKSLVRIAELFTEAVRLHASAIVMAHNHPTGDPTPSPDDLHLTADALAAGRLLDIDLLDHIVLGAGRYVSLRDRGVSFDRTKTVI